MLELAYSTKVYYDDTDAGGVVYYANYLKYCERAKQEFFLKHGCDLFALHNKGLFLVVKEARANYITSLKLSDSVDVYVGVKKLKKASIELLFEIKSGSKTAFKGEILSVMIDKNGKIVRLPECINSLPYLEFR